MKISVLAIGSEILDGRVLNTNSQYISRELSLLGLSLHLSLVCDDVENEIIDALSYLSNTSDLIVVTGGLGPTTDDLTREAIAAFTNNALKKNDASFERLKKRFEDRKRFLDPSNEKQSFFPENSTIIPNPVGTAEGFIVSYNKITICSVPGVPNELYSMFESDILPIIKNRTSFNDTLSRKTFKIFGIPEATVGRKIQSLQLPTSITVSYRAAFPEIHIVLKSKSASDLGDAFTRSVAVIGEEYIFTKNTDKNLPECVGEVLIERKETVSVAESCTAGMLGMHCTAAAGSSRYFVGGFLTYTNDLKEKLLSVTPQTLKLHGAVSEETAGEMSAGCRKKSGSTYGVSITGVAGPNGGSDEKPVGTFCIGISSPTLTKAHRFYFPSDRASIRKYSTYVALDVLRRTILGYPIIDYRTQRD